MKLFTQPKIIASGLMAGLLVSIAPGVARAGDTIFETNRASNPGDGTIGAYTTAGAAVNPSLISGLYLPTAIAVSGSDIFVANAGDGTIGEYTTSGAVVNAALITGLTSPTAIAVSGSDLFVANSGTGIIAKCTTSGTKVDAGLISGLGAPLGLAVSGSDLLSRI
jgi:hypothetical protein